MSVNRSQYRSLEMSDIHINDEKGTHILKKKIIWGEQLIDTCAGAVFPEIIPAKIATKNEAEEDRQARKLLAVQSKVWQAADQFLSHRKNTSLQKSRVSFTQKLPSLLEINPAIERLEQAKKVGEAVRNAALLPSQIRQSLKEHLDHSLSDPNFHNLSRVICSELNEMTLNSNLNPSTGRRLSSEERIYRYCILTPENLAKPRLEREKISLSMPFDCYSKMSDDRKAIVISLIDFESGFINDGTYKTVFKGNAFKIELKVQEQKSQHIASRLIKKTDVVVLRNKAKGDQLSSSKELNVARGVQIHKCILDQFQGGRLGDKSYLASLPVALGRHQGRSEFLQTAYATDLWSLLKYYRLSERVLPLGTVLSERNSRQISMQDINNILVTVAKGLRQMHQAGFIHRDVKPENVLVKRDEEKGLIEGFVADFDLTTPIGFTGIQSKECKYWDKCSQEGLVTYLTDCYGLAMILGETLFEKDSFVSFVQKYEACTDRSKILELEDQMKRTAQIRTLDKILKIAAKNFKDQPKFPKKPLGILNRIIDALDTTEVCEVLKKVNRLLKVHGKQIQDNEKKILFNLKNKVSADSKACDLIIKCIKMSRDLLNYFNHLEEQGVESFIKAFEIHLGEPTSEIIRERSVIYNNFFNSPFNSQRNRNALPETNKFSMANMQEELEIIGRLNTPVGFLSRWP